MFSRYSFGNNSVQLIIGPTLFDKIFRNNHNTKTAVCQTFINFSSKAITNFHFKLIIPYLYSFVSQSVRQRAHYLIFIFRCMRYKYIVFWIYINIKIYS